jgi:hypothetical protein
MMSDNPHHRICPLAQRISGARYRATFQGKKLQIPIHMAEKSAKCSANRTWKRTLRVRVTRGAAGAELFPASPPAGLLSIPHSNVTQPAP